VTPPRAERLAIPTEYGDPTRLLGWDTVAGRLAAAPHYWVATVRPDGRPHVVPLDGLWFEDHLYFGGVQSTVWQRNLRHNRQVGVHLEDTTAAVILDGTCAIEVPTREQADGLVRRSQSKYGYAPPVTAYLGGVWCFSPVRAAAWTDIAEDATRFVFDG
jgi:hypothetical protein